MYGGVESPDSYISGMLIIVRNSVSIEYLNNYFFFKSNIGINVWAWIRTFVRCDRMDIVCAHGDMNSRDSKQRWWGNQFRNVKFMCIRQQNIMLI